MQKWQKIESYPVSDERAVDYDIDGPYVLVAVWEVPEGWTSSPPQWTQYVACKSSDFDGNACWVAGDCSHIDEPSYWMPLPKMTGLKRPR